MEEILHQWISSLSHSLQGFKNNIQVVSSPDFWTINSMAVFGVHVHFQGSSANLHTHFFSDIILEVPPEV